MKCSIRVGPWETCLVVLVVDAEPLPQVPEHHGTVLFELKATRQVFSEGEETHSQNTKHELRDSLLELRRSDD